MIDRVRADGPAAPPRQGLLDQPTPRAVPWSREYLDSNWPRARTATLASLPTHALFDAIALACQRLPEVDLAEFVLPEAGDGAAGGTGAGSADEARLFRARIGQALIRAAIGKGKPLVVEDPGGDPRLPDEDREAIRDFGWRAWLGVPVARDGRVATVLSVWTNRERGFSEGAMIAAAAFAGQAELALERDQLFATVERQRQETAVMSELARSVNASLDLGTVLARATEAAREVCRSDVATIALAEDDRSASCAGRGPGFSSGTLEGARVEVGKGAGGIVLATRRPFRTANYADDPRISCDYLPHVRGEGLVAQLVVPIVAGPRVRGLIYVGDRFPRHWSDQEEAALVRLAEYVAIAIANAEAYQSANDHELALQALTRQLTTAQEAERARLSREIHDEVGQALSAIKISLGLLARDLPADEATVKARVAAASSAVQGALQEVRRIAADLRPYVLDTFGLSAALRSHVERFTQLTGIAVELSVDGSPGRLSAEAQTLLYRVTQEALNNVARHAGATRAGCALRFGDTRVDLTIADDGHGFDPARVLGSVWREGKLGLLGIKERVEAFGGAMGLTSAVGEGTRLTVALPRRDGERAADQAPARGDDDREEE